MAKTLDSGAEALAIPMPATSRRKPTVPILFGAILVALFAAPMVLSPYHMTLLIPFLGYSVVLLGFNLLFGYGGQLSFGHAMFVALGAYGAAASASIWGVTSLELMLLAGLTAGVVMAIPIAWIASRFTGIFFGMLTLSFGMLFHSFLNKFYNITGGDSGMRVPRPTLFGNAWDDLSTAEFLTGPFYLYCLVLLALLCLVMWRIVRSPFGLHLTAQRDNERKAAYLGVQVRRVRFAAFVISAAYGAIGGVILGVNISLADPELAYWTHSGHLVFMAVLGGYREFLGPVVGAMAFILLHDNLMSLTQYWRFFLGLMLAILVIALPDGILGTLRKLPFLRRH
ncbi:branched-chain amino acid ABC transporter permease [Hydrogenophaga laconesensis]|uniref:Branched-chain amino acid transport system permease protein n=1 Tax=Hydrogenophaga laconesensis TaxID=1805971 RepID=A0ABU1V871_9BURK|nr:branched-chain amino acid ABC transporter permease [Hydrogenophaga laconesensis]MDR7093560.1 branched-chain amino acid transport system permease protein [Hydrogenophaga laconesensis]